VLLCIWTSFQRGVSIIKLAPRRVTVNVKDRAEDGALMNLRPKKYCCFRKHGQKNRVGRSFFYNGAYKYTKLLHTFLSLLCSSYIVL